MQNDITTPVNRVLLFDDDELHSIDDSPEPVENIRTPRQTPNRSRRQIQQIMRGKNKIERVKITGDTILEIKHLLNFLPFDRKTSPYVIRKDSIFYTLKHHNVKMPKSASLERMLTELTNVLDYDKYYKQTITGIVLFQRTFRKYLSNAYLRIQGPGIPVSRCVNTECPFTLEELSDIPAKKIITWKDDKIYGCNAELLIESIRKGWLSRRLESAIMTMDADYPIDGTQNPFTRKPLNADLIRRCMKYAEFNNIPGIFVTNVRDTYDYRRRTVRPNRIIATPTTPTTPTTPRRISRGDRRFIQRPEVRDTVVNNPTELISLFEELQSRESSVSECLRRLDFYTPLNAMSLPMEQSIGLLRMMPTINLSQDVSTELTPEVFIRYRREVQDSILPLMRTTSEMMTYSAMVELYRDVNLTQEALGNSYSLRRGIYASHVHELLTIYDHLISNMTGTIGPFHRNYLFQMIIHIYNFWKGFIDICDCILSSPDDVISQDDKRSVAISIISILYSGRFLSDEFEWAASD